MELEHLARTRSDHGPMLLYCGEQSSHWYKPFKFLNFWTDIEDFKEIVRQNWVSCLSDDVFVNFKHKMKTTKLALAKWSKEIFSNSLQSGRKL